MRRRIQMFFSVVLLFGSLAGATAIIQIKEWAYNAPNAPGWSQFTPGWAKWLGIGVLIVGIASPIITWPRPVIMWRRSKV